MSLELVEYYKKEIHDLLDKNLIRKSKSPWSCSAFYVNKAAELKRKSQVSHQLQAPEYSLKWIRYPVPNKSKPFE